MNLNSIAVRIGTTLGLAMKVARPYRQSAAKLIPAAANTVDVHLAQGVESFVSYMDKHSGFSAVLSPTSVMRRVAYRQTEDTINKSRGRQLAVAMSEELDRMVNGIGK